MSEQTTINNALQQQQQQQRGYCNGYVATITDHHQHHHERQEQQSSAAAPANATEATSKSLLFHKHELMNINLHHTHSLSHSHSLGCVWCRSVLKLHFLCAFCSALLNSERSSVKRARRAERKRTHYKLNK